MNPGSTHRRFVLWLAVMLISCGSLEAQRTARTTPRALDELVSEATDIVRGSVASVRVEPHPELNNLQTVVVSLHVHETFKGAARKTLEFRQYVWDIRDQLDAARYRKGEELLLMLGPTSPYGLRSPVGLDQGRFRILRSPTGPVTAENSRANLGLFDSVAERLRDRGVSISRRTEVLLRERPRGPLPLGDLQQAIRDIARSSR